VGNGSASTVSVAALVSGCATIGSRERIIGTMQNVNEVARHAAPGGRPQPLALVGSTLWVGAWDTNTIYAIDPATWAVKSEVAAPGKPYGMAPMGSELRLVISLGEEDDRYLFRFVPGSGFDADSKMACPDFTGSHLACDGSTLYLVQQGNRRVLTLADDGSVVREIALPARCGGLAFDNGTCYMLAADDEWENLEFATFDVRSAEPAVKPIAGVPFDGRGLAFGGNAWWTSNREENEVISFTP
jgi:hypothetical protein